MSRRSMAHLRPYAVGLRDPGRSLVSFFGPASIGKTDPTKALPRLQTYMKKAASLSMLSVGDHTRRTCSTKSKTRSQTGSMCCRGPSAIKIITLGLAPRRSASTIVISRGSFCFYLRSSPLFPFKVCQANFLRNAAIDHFRVFATQSFGVVLINLCSAVFSPKCSGHAKKDGCRSSALDVFFHFCAPFGLRTIFNPQMVS